MGLQIILCMETDNKSRTDWVYINDTIKKYYVLSNEITISLCFLKGKGNYRTSGTIKKINGLIRGFRGNGESKVVYCIDTDDLHMNSEHEREFNDIKDYCDSNGYGFIWFCRDIEEVYWGKRVSKSEKQEYALRFRNSNQMDLIEEKQLTDSKILKTRSNILSVLNEYMERKKDSI